MNLCRSGADVEVASVAAFNDSEQRGRQLANDINSNRYGNTRFNLIGHSQGAPTGRAAITFDAAMNSYGRGRIASLTSVGGVNKVQKQPTLCAALFQRTVLHRGRNRHRQRLWWPDQRAFG